MSEQPAKQRTTVAAKPAATVQPKPFPAPVQPAPAPPAPVEVEEEKPALKPVETEAVEPEPPIEPELETAPEPDMEAAADVADEVEVEEEIPDTEQLDDEEAEEEIIEDEPEPAGTDDTPMLTMDDIHDEPAAPSPKARKKMTRDLDVDELLSGLVPSKQTFIKKMQFDFDRAAFQKFQEANLILELKDENGDVVEIRSFTTQLSKKSGTKKLLLKLNIDLES